MTPKHTLDVSFKLELVIDIYVNTICQYKCPYCCARASLPWGKMMTDSQMQMILAGLKRCKHKVALNILGGEPTLHPKLKWFIESLVAIDNVGTCCLVTNALKDPPQIDNPKFVIRPSWHPTECNDDQFLKYIAQYNNKIVDPVIITLNKFKERAVHVIKTIQEQYPHISPVPTAVVHGDAVIKYDDSVGGVPELILDGNAYTHNQLAALDLNKFQGWRCMMVSFSITPSGLITMACKSLGNLNIVDFLANISPQWVTCDKRYCSDDCHLASPKYLGFDADYEALNSQRV